MPRHIRFNLHAWKTIVLPRLKVWAMVYLAHLLTRPTPRALTLTHWLERAR